MNLNSPTSAGQIEEGIAELKSVRQYWLGDYYPLAPGGLDETVWAGYQFHRADLNGGSRCCSAVQGGGEVLHGELRD